jgi:hypothetical protein
MCAQLTKAEDDEDPSSDENATSSDVPDDEEFDDDINSDCADAADGDIGDTDDDTNSSIEHRFLLPIFAFNLLYRNKLKGNLFVLLFGLRQQL